MGSAGFARFLLGIKQAFDDRPIMTISVCIFARDEERTLPECVGALDRAGLGRSDMVHILVNGCRDNTALVARALSEADTRIITHELPIGDKANAWNEYVHRLADETCSMHVFLDGDVYPSVGALCALKCALSESPDSYAAAALPASGRSQRGWALRLMDNHYLSGNLYALSASGLAAFRQAEMRLPIGAKGEDGVITYLLLTDMIGGEDDSHKYRIAVAPDATFEFNSLGLRVHDWKIYKRRLRRYSARHFQKKALYKLLKAHGAHAMPETIDEIYTPDILGSMRPRLDPVNFWFDFSVLSELRDRV
jgi:glycosyltransferase involved in cell wall biosynthesis